MNKKELENKVEELERNVIVLRAQIVMLKSSLELEKAAWTRLALEKNALIEMLQTLFHFHVFCREVAEGDVLLWDVEDTLTGKEIVHHEKDVTQAYKQAIQASLPDTFTL